jgi:hypothetical protein
VVPPAYELAKVAENEQWGGRPPASDAAAAVAMPPARTLTEAATVAGKTLLARPMADPPTGSRPRLLPWATMLRKKNQPGGSSTDTADDDSGVHGNGMSYGLHEYGDSEEDADAEQDAEYYDDADGDDDEYYDEDEEAGDEGEPEEFAPPTAASALRRSFGSRTRAQPATGTDEDAKKVNFIDRRERMIGYFLGVMLVALAVVSYIVDRRYVDKSNLKLQSAIHSEAPWILVITIALAALILLSTVFKRRAALGFTLLLAGVALFNGDFLIGLVYLGTGLWLDFRSMRRSPRSAAARAGGTGGRARGRSSTTTTARGARSSSGASAPSSSTTSSSIRTTPGRQIGRNGRLSSSSTPTGRYTPPKPVRHVPPPAQSEPEPTNRLSAWLKK